MLQDDEPIKSCGGDKLGFSGFSQEITRMILNVPTPYVFGIYGRWGSGKTSIINFVMENLQANPKVEQHYFDAWRYEQAEDMLQQLLISLELKYEAKGKGAITSKLHAVIHPLSEIVVRFIAQKLTGVPFKKKGDLEKFASEIGVLSKEWQSKIDVVRTEFSDAIKAILENQKKELFVTFIDNLDRCNPEKAVHLLESIKNYLTVEKCLFVIAVDDDVLASYIDQKYSGTKMDGHAYLEKVVQVKMNVPLPGPDTFKKLSGAVGVLVIGTDSDSLLVDKLRLPRTVKKILNRCILWELVAHAPQPMEVFVGICLYEGWPQFYLWITSADEETAKALIRYLTSVSLDDLNARRSQKERFESTKIPESFTKDEELQKFLEINKNTLLKTGELERIKTELRKCGIW